MAFKDIKGQERAVEFFRNCVNRDRLAHAYLFSGFGGLGKTLLAQILAKFLNCENPVKKVSSLIDCCDSCASCRKIDSSNHPDVHWIEPVGRSGRVAIDQVRSMQKQISLKSYEGRFKVFIIQDAHKMTQEAANCLLKTLEEPPDWSLVILTATNISGLLPTIISRCQIIKFYPLNYDRLKEILKADYALDEGYLHFLSAASEGRIGRALSLKNEDSFVKKNRLIDKICAVERGASFNMFNIKDKKNLPTQIRYLLNWFRDILIFKAGAAAADVINADRIEDIKSWASIYSFDDLEQVIAKINTAHRLIEQNVNPKIALEVMLGEIAKCKR